VNPLLAFALDLARKGEDEILPRFRNTAVSLKPDGSEVTDADREAERVMREAIGQKHPDHAILGEEWGRSGPENARHVWILDPVDGTASFALGLPTFGTLIGLVEDGEPTIGVCHFPALDYTVYAARGEGCFLRRGRSEPQRLQVARVASLREAYVSTSSLPGGPLNVAALARGAGRIRIVNDCVQHALVCEGKLQVAVDAIMKPWDIAALVPCVREAGGRATGLDGKDAGVVDAGGMISSCGGPVHDEAIAALRSAS
jgi:histidinol-phosphatase